MKSIIGILSILILFGCYGKKPKMKTGLEGKPMPDIDLILPDTTNHFNTAKIATGKPTILFSFEPWCPYCKAQTKAMIAQIKSFKDVNICFLTNSTYPGFKEFCDRFQLEKYPNIKAGIDYNYGFMRYFQTKQIPVLAIYDRNKKLKQVLVGKNYVSTIKEIVLE